MVKKKGKKIIMTLKAILSKLLENVS